MADISTLTDHEIMSHLHERGVSCIINTHFEFKNGIMHIKPTISNKDAWTNLLGCDFTKLRVVTTLLCNEAATTEPDK